MPLIQANYDVIKDFKSKTENFISPGINDISQSDDFVLNQHVTAKIYSDFQVPSMTAHGIVLIDSFEGGGEELETQQQSLVKMDSQHGQFPSRWNHQRSEIIGYKGVTYKRFYFGDPDDAKKWMRYDMNNPFHELFAYIASYSKLFGNENYIERNKTLNELYMSNKIGYGTKSDSIVVTSFQIYHLHHMESLVLVLKM